MNINCPKCNKKVPFTARYKMSGWNPLRPKIKPCPHCGVLITWKKWPFVLAGVSGYIGLLYYILFYLSEGSIIHKYLVPLLLTVFLGGLMISMMFSKIELVNAEDNSEIEINRQGKTKKIIYLFVITPLLIYFLSGTLFNTFIPPSKKESHGLIKYKLIDLGKNTVISTGEIRVKNYYSRKTGIFSKYIMGFTEDNYIEVYDDFVIGFNQERGKFKGVTGFGMRLSRLNQEAFSWEWYRQKSGNLYDKLQGEGQLNVEFRENNNYWEFSRITFIGEHTFRARKKGILPGSQKTKENWNCIIFDGSFIEF